MARNRTISPDFWTCEALIDCAPMTRLLFIGLWSFADDGGVQPLRPRTIRMQVFPGDTIENDSVRAMIDELAARGLVRIYAVDGVEYVAIVDWAQTQRVGRRPRLRWPFPSTSDHSNSCATEARERHPTASSPDHSKPEQCAAEATEGPPASTFDQSKPEQDAAEAGEGTLAPPSDVVALEAPQGAPADLQRDEARRWRGMIRDLLHQYWPHHAAIESMDDVATERWMAKWIAEGCDYGRDIVPVVRDFYLDQQFCGPPVDIGMLDGGVVRNRTLHA
jgi:hypothetical protein